MTHEFKTLIQDYLKAKALGVKTVLATVVHLDGSSYRRPGVRMLLWENGKMTGAVSGGCVEKEVFRQAQTVFASGIPKMMTYDGRYRLGCEGILYLMLEPFNPEITIVNAFHDYLSLRKPFEIRTYYTLKEGDLTEGGSTLVFESETHHSFSPSFNIDNAQKEKLKCFTQQLNPCFKLFIFGTEHDAVQLTQLGHFTGWEVTVFGSVSDTKTLENFPGATELIHIVPEEIPTEKIDAQSAVILMSHSFVTDLKYLIALKNIAPVYLGLLGPSTRREKLLNALLEHSPEVNDSFFEVIHGPAGLNLGAETPQEIAVSIVAEILSIMRDQTPMPLKNKNEHIHHGVRL